VIKRIQEFGGELRFKTLRRVETLSHRVEILGCAFAQLRHAGRHTPNAKSPDTTSWVSSGHSNGCHLIIVDMWNGELQYFTFNIEA
jgi:hypothetical protein